MVRLATLEKLAQLYADQADSAKQEQVDGDRKSFVEISVERGGVAFVDAVRRYGCNERGTPINLTNWYQEYLETIGNLNIHEVYTTGPAQVGKTLGHTLLLCYCLTEGKLNTLWVYDQERTLNRNVPLQFRPAIAAWLKRMGQRRRSEGSQNNTLFQLNGANAMFSYVSTSKPNLRDGGAAAGSAIVSVTADILFADERSQMPPGSTDPLPRRLDASILPTKPQRDLGTCGSGNGIEKEVARCDHHFYPHFTCDKCQRSQPLDPKGCLLKSVKRLTAAGQEVDTYFSESGRPLDWWHSDPLDAVGSAYFGCAYCGHPIRDEQRKDAWFACTKTGITLRQYLDELNQSSGNCE